MFDIVTIKLQGETQSVILLASQFTVIKFGFIKKFFTKSKGMLEVGEQKFYLKHIESAAFNDVVFIKNGEHKKEAVLVSNAY